MPKNSGNYGDWLERAGNDLKAALAIFNYYEDPPSDTVCYHCHQVAEKALKGYIVSKEGALPKIHDLVALFNICLQLDKDLEISKDDLEVLDQYYIEAKYPLDMPISYSKEEAKDAIDKAMSILKTIKDKLGYKDDL